MRARRRWNSTWSTSPRSGRCWRRAPASTPRPKPPIMRRQPPRQARPASPAMPASSPPPPAPSCTCSTAARSRRPGPPPGPDGPPLPAQPAAPAGSCSCFLIPSSPFFSFHRERKGKKRIIVMTDQTPDHAPGQAGDQVLYCRRPGCGAPVPQAGHGRPRQYCSDACTSAYHNASRASRARGTDPGTVTAETDGLPGGPDGDTLPGLEALLRQAAALARHARAEAALLDPAHVRAQLADADAGRRRAEAAAVVAHAQAAEAGQELQAALEALDAARRLQQAAETRAGHAEAAAAAAAADAAAVSAARASADTAIT